MGTNVKGLVFVKENRKKRSDHRFTRSGGGR